MSPWQQRHDDQVDGEIQDISHVVAQPERIDRVFHDDLQVLTAKSMRTAESDVEIDVFCQRRYDHALCQRLYDQVSGKLGFEKPKDIDGIVTAPFVGVLVRFLDALEQALPNIPRQELFVRMSMVVGVLIHIATGMQEAPLLSEIATPIDDDEAVLKPAIAFLAAGFRAPSTMNPITIETPMPMANGFGAGE